MRLEFWGAAHTVTGSCYLLESNDKRYLIDCGMFQGARRVRMLNYNDFSFNPADIEAVVLTHAHVDHSGLIPKLVRQGFKGTVYATKATCLNGVESVRKNCQEEKRFNIKVASNGKPYFNLMASNGQIIGSSQMYANEANMKNGIASVQKNAPDAEIVDLTEEK